ncbi:hypothetical protein [Paenibacillus sp. UNC499MF]|uniref:hypothetical protein n=1 Tax=Paenibacillus sp. UNC499MF TaxID=1502751 RepID=UPI000CDE9B75|nr:hypothetical protein [Paenibacillus sp. UNC499MF]
MDKVRSQLCDGETVQSALYIHVDMNNKMRMDDKSLISWELFIKTNGKMKMLNEFWKEEGY